MSLSPDHADVPRGTECIPGLTGLSPREQEVVVLVCEGFSSKEIARQIGITPKAVEAARDRIALKTGMRHTALVVRWAIRKGLVTA